MVRPTFFQKVLGRPSQRYTSSDETRDICQIQDLRGYRGTPEEPPQLDLRCTDDADEPFFTPLTSPLPSPQNSPSITPPLSAASSSLSLADAVRSSVSLSDHATFTMPHKSDRKLTYTDEDWARDVRWLAAPRTDGSKHTSKASKRRSAPGPPTMPILQIPASRSTSSLPSRRTVSTPHPHPPRSSKNKGITKAKISTARSVVGMSALLEVEEDLDPDPPLDYPTSVPQKYATSSVSLSPAQSPGVYHKPRVSSPLRSSKPTRQRSFSSPSLLDPDQSPYPLTTISNQDPSIASSSRRAFSASFRSLAGSSSSRSPYTSPPPNVLDALVAHVSVSDSHDTLPSSGTRGYSNLFLPRAATSPSLALDHRSSRIWKIGKAQPAGATVRDTIGVGLGLGDQVDLSRARLAQTTMASVEIVRGIAARSAVSRKSHRSRRSVFGTAWFSKDKPSAAAEEKNLDTDSPLGFTAYRKPPVYVGGGSILVQVWGVGLDGTDARLAGIHPPRAGPSLPGAPYGTKTSKTGEKDKPRCPPAGYIPGRSFIGRVLEVGWEVGPDVAKRGDWVIGLMSVHKCGALAEFILADRHHLHRVPNPFTHLKYPFSSFAPTGTVNEADGDVSRRRDPSPPSIAEECLTVNELALLPLCGVPAYRAVRTLHQITQSMGKSQLPYGNSHNELHPILPPRNDKHDFTAGGGQDDIPVQVPSHDSRPRTLILRAHDGAGALAVQMLVREGWCVWAHVPVPFALPGPPSELPDELRDEEEERELDNQRDILRRIEDRLREWGADEVLFVPVTSMPLSTMFDASNPTLEAMSSRSSPSIQLPRSPSSSPSISPSPFSRSSTSTPMSSPYSNGFSSGHLPSLPSSSSHQNVFMTPYSFTALPLTPYDCEQASIVALMSYLTRSRVRLDAILDTIGGREIWDASRQLLSRPVRDASRQDVEAQFTTLVGDSPDRVVSTAGDNFRAGVRALRLRAAKDQHPFEDSGYHEAVTTGQGRDKSKIKPRPVNYSWVNVVSDIDWEGSDVHDTLCTVMRMVSSDGIKPVVGPPDFAKGGRRDKGKKRSISMGAEGMEEGFSGKVVPFESTPDVFLPGGGLEYGGTIVSRVAS